LKRSRKVFHIAGHLFSPAKKPIHRLRQGHFYLAESSVKTILFVDDHEVLARLSCEILESHGYRAVSAFSAADALAKFDKQQFDMLITDFRMDGMNGLELARKLRSRRPELPVIIVTGYGPIAQDKDFNLCLPKDELFPTLLEKMKLFLGDSEEESSAYAEKDVSDNAELKTGS
jgi:CheY-like chemotaxis protein